MIEEKQEVTVSVEVQASELTIINQEFELKTEVIQKKSLKQIASRVQSPSSILTYKQCPRKYYYQYIAKLPTRENVHLVRGKIVHEVLERFFEIPLDEISDENYVEHLTYYVKNLFNGLWSKERPSIIKLGLTEDQIVFYYEETIMMLANWLNQFLVRLRGTIDGKDVRHGFEALRPVALEKGLSSDVHMVRGFIDYIEEYIDSTTPDGEKKVKVMDYKTSKSSELTDNYRLQLAIYALLYEETYGKKPNKVGLWFLKNGKEVCVNVDEELLQLAKFEVEQIHFNTQTKKIDDYHMKSGPLCKWSTGQCDFYDQCFPNGRRNEW